jgi:demethylmenaquinone methyltransferase/2-methoxy-6-polyprenyl-1,4-benzoquinol methylase
VNDVFHSVAQRYDLMNDLMSGGVHRLWKNALIDVLNPRVGEKFLDVAGGTGDIAFRIVRRVGDGAEVTICDINPAMLEVGRDRMIDQGVFAPLAICDAEKLPFPDASFDCVSVAFGLRNMTHKDRALAEMTRVTRPGGRVIVLEFSRPWKPLAPAYDAYSFSILPALGKWIARDEGAYRYLAESIRMHPDQETLKSMMAAAGLERVDYFNLAAGVVALHRGFKL